MNPNNTIFTRTYHSPCGDLILGSIGNRLCVCDWIAEPHHYIVNRRLRRMLHADFVEKPSPITEATAKQLDEYFERKRVQFDIPLYFIGSDFQKSVWESLFEIPYGETISYADISRKLGRPKSVRAVANAIGANAISIIVPCHRVIGNNGSLTGYAGGLQSKQYLLSLENPSLFCSNPQLY